MTTLFAIVDEAHDEPFPSFPRRAEAIAALELLAALPWDRPPNQAPCTNWRQCGRRYELVEYDVSAGPQREVRREPALDVSVAGARWHLSR